MTFYPLDHPSLVITGGQCICQRSVVPAWRCHRGHEHQGDRQPWRRGQTAYSSSLTGLSAGFIGQSEDSWIMIDQSEASLAIIEESPVRVVHGMMAVCQGWVHLMHWHGVHARHLVFLFPFHPPVLEPDLDLSLCQTQRMRDLDPASSCEISVEVKLFFQF